MTDDDREDEVNKVGPPASDRGVYGISVAAELSGISEQSLRLYERQGLLTPARSVGGTRRYSADDLARLQRISELVAAGVNLAGIDRILSLEDRNASPRRTQRHAGGRQRRVTHGEFARTSFRQHRPSRGRVRGARTSAAGRPVAACDARLRHTTRDTRREIALIRVVARRQPIPGTRLSRPEPRDGYVTGRWVAPRSAAWSSIALPMACAARSTNSVPLPITQSRDACGPSRCPVKCGITYCANSS